MKLLLIDGVPSLMVIDGDMDRATSLRPSIYRTLRDELPQILDQLLDGKSTHESTLSGLSNNVWLQYRRLRNLPIDPTVESNNSEVVISKPVAAVPSREPKNYRLKSLWSKPVSDQLKQPGNMIVVQDAGVANGEPRMIILDGWQAVCEYDLKGEQIARYELKLPEKNCRIIHSHGS